jgi:hypothetical protein
MKRARTFRLGASELLNFSWKQTHDCWSQQPVFREASASRLGTW